MAGLDDPGVLPSVRENLSVLTSRAGFNASTPFSVRGCDSTVEGGQEQSAGIEEE